jgi:hypothetical protein
VDRWFVIVLEIVGTLAALVGLWWLYEQARWAELGNQSAELDLRARREAPARKARKPKEEPKP